jgi:hypothetical protein
MSRIVWRSVAAVLFCVSACGWARAAGGDLASARDHKLVAVEHLRKADEPQADRTKELRSAETELVAAQKILSAFEEPVPPEIEAELSEVNSLIYWTRKMMPLKGGKLPQPAPRREPTSRPKPRTTPDSRSSPAKRHFEAAQRYAAQNPSKPFLVAVRFFEVATRYSGTSWGTKAQHLALEYQKKALSSPKVAAPGAGGGRPGSPTKRPTAAKPGSKNLVWRPVRSEYGDLRQALKENTSRAKKINACRAYLERFEGGTGSLEVKAILDALSAEATDTGTLTWLDYLVAYPQGLMTGRALDALRRSEDTAFAEIARSLATDDIDRAVRICRASLRALPGRSWAGQLKSLMSVLKYQPGQARTRLAHEHVRKYSRGELARMLTEVIGRWELTDEQDSFDLLRARFSGTRYRRDRTTAIKEFLSSYPKGPHAPEVKALGLTVISDDARKRVEGAHRYLNRYPRGAFLNSVRELAAGSVEEVNRRLFSETMRRARSGGVSYKDRLAATEKYLEEFPDGDRARQVKEVAQEVRKLIAEEARAYDELAGVIKDADSGTALRACSAFLAKHASGTHGQKVTAMRDDYGRRLSAENEARAYETVIAGISKPALSRIRKADALVKFLGSFGRGKNSRDARARLRKLAPGRLDSFAGPVRAATFSSDSKTLVVVDADVSHSGTGVWVWNTAKGKLVARYQASSGFSACSVAFGPGDRQLWVGETNGGLITWDASSGRILGRYRVGGGPISATASVGDGLIAITASLGDTKLRLWDAADWLLDDSVKCLGAISCAAASPDGELIAVGQEDGSISCYENSSLVAKWTEVAAHAGVVSHLCFSPDGAYVASASPDSGSVSLHDARSGRMLWEIESMTPTVAFVGKTGVLTSEGLRNMDSGSMRAKLGGSGPVAASPDGNYALTTDGKGGGTLWYIPALLH